MGGVCPKPAPEPRTMSLMEAIEKIHMWNIIQTPAFTLMASSFCDAHNRRVDTAVYFARALLIITGLSELAEQLDDRQVTCAALVIVSRAIG